MPLPETDVAGLVEASPPDGTALPVEAATAPEPALEAAPVVEASDAAPAEAEAAPEAPAAEPAVDTGSLVEAAAEPAVEEAKPAEAEPPAPPTYEAFTMPEGLSASPEQIEAFTGAIGKYGLTQEAGQELMDLHGAVLKDMQGAMDQRQRDVFDQTRAAWRDEFAKQAGNRRDTLLQDAKWAISDLVPDPKARAEVWSALSFSGMGDHPAIINLLAKAAGRMRERAAPASGLGPKAQGQSKPDQRYGAPRQTS